MRGKPGTDVVGDFEVKSGKMVVSDPCYTRGTWCAGILENVKNGKWTAEVEITEDTFGWGRRVASIYAFAEGERGRFPSEPVNFEVGVDSGQVCLADEAVYPQPDQEIGEYGDTNTWYGRACAANGDAAGYGVFEDGRAVVTASGYGDGSYVGFVARDENGEIVGVQVIFIGDEDEYEDEDEEWDDEDDLDEEEEDEEDSDAV